MAYQQAFDFLSFIIQLTLISASAPYGIDECQYASIHIQNDKGHPQGAFSWAINEDDPCYIKSKDITGEYATKYECNSDTNIMTQYNYNNLWCDGHYAEKIEITNNNIQPLAQNLTIRDEVHCDNDITKCATYAYMYDVSSCDSSKSLETELSEASYVYTWTYQFGVYGFCGKYYPGPYAPSLDIDGAYFTLDSCSAGSTDEIKVRQYATDENGEGQCSDTKDENLGDIEFDFIHGNCVSVTEFNKTTIGEIFRVNGDMENIEGDYIKIYVKCGESESIKEKWEGMVGWIFLGLISFVVILAVGWCWYERRKRRRKAMESGSYIKQELDDENDNDEIMTR